MDWKNYLLEEKAPYGALAHLGKLEGIEKSFDLSQLPPKTKIIVTSNQFRF